MMFTETDDGMLDKGLMSILYCYMKTIHYWGIHKRDGILYGSPIPHKVYYILVLYLKGSN